jgi:SpoVK/Ycf46/Vps4 family AAA+-type ATPase
VLLLVEEAEFERPPNVLFKGAPSSGTTGIARSAPASNQSWNLQEYFVKRAESLNKHL